MKVIAQIPRETQDEPGRVIPRQNRHGLPG
jgi:hypothetical protein